MAARMRVTAVGNAPHAEGIIEARAAVQEGIRLVRIGHAAVEEDLHQQRVKVRQAVELAPRHGW